ncbi:hypothetical protein OMP38_31735 [Cohnella ginsengisoli]|uniref:Uncharacterized protein n=1 Tax=Cohnella ginsengisoli TaxID=425004 RepID=A0A9X4KMZ0_9BACL|nr:hypothetical protein [Cohnella ginsengisoli]MDG0794891.1 hypothetical protein [Cohnella ginsengisoli]
MYRTLKKMLLIGICGALALAGTWHLVNEAFWDGPAVRQVSSSSLKESP